jgi:Xaa-Pro aminopeptidase
MNLSRETGGFVFATSYEPRASSFGPKKKFRIELFSLGRTLTEKGSSSQLVTRSSKLPATLLPMDYAARQRRLQTALEGNRLDLLLVTHLPDVRYLSGFTGSAAALLISQDGTTLFTDSRYIAQAKAEVRGVKVVISRTSPAIAAAERLAGTARRRSATQRLGIESESVTAGLRDRIAKQLAGKARLRSAPPLVARARMIKDADEIAHIGRAVKLGAGLFQVALKTIRPGVTELEVAAAMEYFARSAGAEGMSFPTIVASGKRSALVHGRASSACIPRRGFVVCDFGVILAGYCSDRTRTVHVGRATNPARDMYSAVLDAQQAAIAAVGPGVTAADVDEAARRVLRRRKLARYFTHSTGHGLGLEVHEAPRLAAGQQQRLEPGMVVTIEPGAYIADTQGVRIEDVVVVTASGREVLTPGDKEFIAV